MHLRFCILAGALALMVSGCRSSHPTVKAAGHPTEKVE